MQKWQQIALLLCSNFFERQVVYSFPEYKFKMILLFWGSGMAQHSALQQLSAYINIPTVSEIYLNSQWLEDQIQSCAAQRYFGLQ